MIDPQLPAMWQEYPSASFIAASGTQAKILVDVAPPIVVPAIPGETALPNGESAVRQRVRTGGQRIIDGSISSTDATPRSLLLYLASLLSLFANMGAPTVTGTNAINRTAGSFITDGWQVGDSAMGFGYTTAANNGVMAIVTAVTGSGLTFNGTPFTNETIPAGFRLFRVSQKTRKPIPANSGNTDILPPIPLLGGPQDPTALLGSDIGLSLGPNGALIAAMAASVSALPAQVQAHAISVLY